MGRRLAGYVPIHDGDQTVWYGPDDKIPAKIAEQIGDHAWIDDEADASGDDGGSGVKPPPMAGKGSGVEAWAEYAKSLDVQVAEDAKREDIVTALRDAGHPVE